MSFKDYIVLTIGAFLFLMITGIANATEYKTLNGSVVGVEAVYETDNVHTPNETCTLKEVPIYGETKDANIVGAIIGYNYTKNPAVTHARRLIESGVIGRVAAFFCRYDVDNEADGDRPWSWRMSRDQSGTGANGDVLSHVISVAHYLTGSTIKRVVGDIAIVHGERDDPQNKGSRKSVDNDDMVAALVQFENGVHGHIGASRVTWGYKCGLRWEVHGTKGTIIFEQERLNELKLFNRQDDPATDGFRTILTGPDHPPYSAFLPNGGHSLGYMDVKICELHELLKSIETGEAAWPSFNDGLVIEQVMDAVDKSSLSGQWVDVGSN